MVSPYEVLEFWLEDVGPKGWYLSDVALDDRIRSRFGDAWEAASRGEYAKWRTCARGALAYIILTDQFPRNMFRGSGQAFATDHLALAAAKSAIPRNWDLRTAEPQRQFFYLPLMHSESLSDQERCVRLMMTRMPESGEGNLLHARAHRNVIRQFGRFPYRNDALARPTTEVEDSYVAAGGYGETVRLLQAAG